MDKPHNPFAKGDYAVSTSHVYTTVSAAQLKTCVYKTLNRIVDDIRFSVALPSILGLRPRKYADDLAQAARSRRPDLLFLNNALEFCPRKSTAPLNDDNQNQNLVTLRGLVVDDQLAHVRVQVLQNSAFFGPSGASKHEFYSVPVAWLSADDVAPLVEADGSAPSFLHDEFFVSPSASDSCTIVRVTLFPAEFDYLEPLLDADAVKNRYAEHADSSISDFVPTPVHCLKKLLNVLKGPLLLEPEAPVKTINLQTTSLTALIDPQMLVDKLGFTLENDHLVPPSLAAQPHLRESFVRKALELIYIAKSLEGDTEFASYSFSDNGSLIYSTFNEYDKHICITYGKLHNSNELPYFVDLSITTFFSDELIIKCFELTVASDSRNKIFYVDDLKRVIDFKSNSAPNSKLKTYVNNNNLLGYHDYIAALRNLNLETSGSREQLLNYDPDVIISVYENNIKSDYKNYSFFNRNLKNVASLLDSQRLIQYIADEILPVGLAINELGVEEITEDEVVITAYEFKLDDILQANNFNEHAPEIQVLHQSLLSLAINRKSYILMNYIEKKLPKLIASFTATLALGDCLEVLEVGPNANDFEIITSFQNKILTSDIRKLRQALKSLSSYKNSKILHNFLINGKIDPSLLPVENWPAGLDNIGNTCYLNSLLQYYFSIKPIRDMVLQFDHEHSHEAERKIGGRKVEADEIKRSGQFVFHLQKLFTEMIHTNRRCVEPSKDLAYLSFLPSSQPVNFLTHAPGAKESPILIDSDEEDTPGAEVVDEAVEVLDDGEVSLNKNPFDDVSSVEELSTPSEAKSCKRSKITTTDIDTDHVEYVEDSKLLPISTEEMESTIEIGRQQDVTECIENVNFQIETALPPEKLESDGEQVDLIKRLFYGKTKQTITPIDGEGKPRTSVERFSSLIINISDHPKDIYDALDNYFNEDIVKLEEGVVKKTLTISELPEILQFQVQRVLFDRERLMAYKSIEPIPFDHKLYVDRYLETEDPEMLTKREQVFKWKSEIRDLQQQKESILTTDKDTKMNILDSLVLTRKYLESVKDQEELEITEAVLEFLDAQISELKDKVAHVDEMIGTLTERISSQFSDYKKVGYSIFAIFIHRGEASYGHYWIYIKDPHNKQVFRKYNDEIVSEVPESEVFNFVKGNTATPYFIVYVKEDLESAYVEPLRRDVPKQDS